jgi:hypothetical protein
VTQVSKTEFRKAQCKGSLDGCEILHGINGSVWLRGGRVVALKRTRFLSTYFLEA